MMRHLTLSSQSNTPLPSCSRRTFLKGAALAGAVATFPSLMTGCGSSSGDVPLEQKIAQMLMVGFRGLTLDDSNYIVRDIRDYRIGGTILFDRDAKLKTSTHIVIGAVAGADSPAAHTLCHPALHCR